MNEVKAKDKVFIPLITIVSVAVPVVVAMLILQPAGEKSGGYERLPLFHALLNGATAILLITGYFFIRHLKIPQHRACMLSAFALSCIFLISYVIYHFHTGHTPYGGTGFLRPLYFFILITHISLAAVVIPFALFAIYRALSGQIDKHRKIVKWTLPVWLYVAITGVLVYLLMMPYYGEW